jgi:hypothetical protein
MIDLPGETTFTRGVFGVGGSIPPPAIPHFQKGKLAIFPSEIARVPKAAKVKENASFGKEFVMQRHA